MRGTEGGAPTAALTPDTSWAPDNGSGAPAVSSVLPRFSGEATAVHVTDLHGAGFQDGAQVKLSRAGQPDIEATNENVISANQISCDLDLSEAAWGAWDVVVTNPDLSSAGLHGAFFVGTAYGQAWGWNEESQCDVPAGNDFVAISAGGTYSLALRSDGSLAAWGENYYHQCDVPAGNGFVAVSAGDSFSLSLCRCYLVNASVLSGQGTVNPTSQKVTYGESAQVKITPDPGWHIAGITDNGNPVTIADPSGMTYTLENVTENHLVEVVFELNTYAVACSVSPQGSGSVTGTGNYTHGSQVTLTANPAAGYHFLRWTEGGTQVSTENPYKFTATANRTLVAVFEQEVSPQTTFYFAEGYTGKDTFEEYLCLMNPNEEQTTAHITYMFSDGSTKEQDLPIGKTSRATVNVKAAVGEDRDVSVKVTSSLPIVCERPMYFNYAGAWTGGHVVMGYTP
nr:hypothetical protein [Candidatus Solincola tengchongensis]